MKDPKMAESDSSTGREQSAQPKMQDQDSVVQNRAIAALDPFLSKGQKTKTTEASGRPEA